MTRRAQDHTACVLLEMGRCGAPCDGTIDARTYAAQTAAVAALVAGDASAVLAALRARMGALAADHRYEEAGRVRARLHGLARTVHVVRLERSLAAAGTLAVVAEVGDHIEGVRLHDGHLVASVRVPRRAGHDTARDALAAVPDQPPPVDRASGAARAERVLLARWLARTGPARVVGGDGRWLTRVAGGRQLHGAVAEAAAVDRAGRRDAQVLRGAKVARRSAATDTAAADRSGRGVVTTGASD